MGGGRTQVELGLQRTTRWRRHWERRGVSGNVGRPHGEYDDIIANDIAGKLRLEPDDWVLNVGSGSGILEKKFPDLFILSLDFARNMLKRSGVPRAVLAAAQYLPIRGSTVTKVCAYSIVHYLSNTELRRFIAEMESCTKEGGTCLIGDVPLSERHFRSRKRRLVYLLAKFAKRGNMMFEYHSQNTFLQIFGELGLKAQFVPQSRELPYSSERFDILVTKSVGKATAPDFAG